MNGMFGQPKLDQCLQECQRGFGTLILIGAVGMQTIAAATGSCVVQGQVQIVAPQEPFEGAARLLSPILLARQAVGFQAGRHHPLGFHRLLVEAGAFAALRIKTVGADRYEVPAVRLRVLQFSQPAKRF